MTVMALPSGEALLDVTTGIEPPWLDSMKQYGAEIVEQWGGVVRINSHPIDEPAVLSRMRPRSEWGDSRYYREWATPQGLNDVMALVLAREPGTIGSIAMARHVSAGAICEREVDAARLLIPHLQRAMAISRMLDLKSVVAATFQSALDTLAAAVVLVDADLRIVHANKAAETMLAAGDPIRSKGGMLETPRPAAAAALRLAVRQAADNEAAIGRRGFGIPAPRADGSPCVLHVLPLQHGAIRSGLKPSAAAAVFVAPATSPIAAPSQALAALFDLTAMEARLFSHIATGMTLSESARELGIGLTTARTHLLHLFAKTDTHRQADLVRLAASLAAPR
ncbi:MAG: helix-turn-helix transcriptional regulator [Pseudomonadota bacterium]|nr:helix-turn-helix transcriptional regulator [Pseudomonadota bacterium]